jgi:hypothetical protein
MTPFGPAAQTAPARLATAFRFISEKWVQLTPPSRETSEPLVPTEMNVFFPITATPDR